MRDLMHAPELKLSNENIASNIAIFIVIIISRAFCKARRLLRDAVHFMYTQHRKLNHMSITKTIDKRVIKSQATVCIKISRQRVNHSSCHNSHSSLPLVW